MSPETLTVAAPLIPALGAVAIAALGRAPNLREAATLATAVALFAAVLALLPAVLAGERPGVLLVQMLPGLDLGLRVEPLGMLFACVAAGLWVVNSIYAIGYMRANGEPHQTRFYVCFALALAATMGIAFAADLLTLFLFYELLTLVTWPLVAHHGDESARAGGRTYLAYLVGTSVVLLLPAIVATGFLAGSLRFEPGGVLAGAGLSSAQTGLLLALYMFGIGKAALMPFHRWLPAAMVAPTPVSALLHAVAVVKAGVFAVVKVIVYTFGTPLLGQAASDWLPVVAGVTIVAASVAALRSDNLKRRLAYSTVSQLAYVVLAAALLAPRSITAAALHVAAHALGKITLFFAAGAIYTAAHKTEVSELDGIGRRMPWTMGAFALGALSMVGLPPAAGFVSKWYLAGAVVELGHWSALAVLVAGTVLSAAYLAPVLYRAFLRPEPAGTAPHGEAPVSMVAALTITAMLTIAFFFAPQAALELARAVGQG